MDSNLYQNGYVAQREPYYYGTPLKDYQQRVERIVEGAVQEMRRGSGFLSILGQLAQERQKIALDQKTPGAFEFGLRRDSAEALKSAGPVIVTTLHRSMAAYGQRLLQRITSLPAQGRLEKSNAQFEWETLTLEETWRRQRSVFQHPALKTKIDIAKLKPSFKDYCTSDSPKEQEAFYRQFLEAFRDNKLLPVVRKGEKFCLGTLTYETHPLSRYYIPQCQGRWGDPILLHPDFFSIQHSLDAIAILFDLSLQEPLQERLALFSYLFAHTMPFCRGSAAIREWLEKSIYQLHRFRIVYHPDRPIDLEALTTISHLEFLEKYPTLFEFR